ncbi:hypothetical protein [Chamaesiphon sp. VAR_48_metabat_403]|uniref:hypothetical protein n=1 Tax=Chamaesiphon sp. VAR_48_metabat_403 TaxID=2964700 RepID=UPI00286E8728|nr:hypothetical protein [Chamaesiphon sp. VAR_48_metabat_403]
MPRLIGRTSKAPLYTILALFVVAAVATELEYEGVIDLVPGYGRNTASMKLPDIRTPRS